LQGRRELFDELALLDQGYHDFCDPDSLFARLQRGGQLEHRVGPRIEPGSEPEPFVPETGTRARARARFIREHAPGNGLRMDWSCVQDVPGSRLRRLCDPLAADYGPWEPAAP
jgi:hypothetical protein